MNKLYVHYGCGLSAPKEWVNFDASPTLRIQKTPILGFLLKKRLNVLFPDNVKYGDIVKGLPIAKGSCDGMYCSHILEHLALNNFRIALQHTYDYLKEGGIFRCVVPDLRAHIREYDMEYEKGNPEGSIDFVRHSKLGTEDKKGGLVNFLVAALGNSQHQWMWDTYSLSNELAKVGFKNIRSCSFNDSKDEMFKLVENEGRFPGAVAIECTK